MSKRKRKPPATSALCAWCKKVVRVRRAGGDKEVPVSESGFTAREFDLSGSHGICKKCAAELMKGVKAVKNPGTGAPSWVRDKAKWKEALDVATVVYGRKVRSRQSRDVYAAIISIYKNLGGRVKRRVLRNPSDSEWEAVIGLFGEFHGFDPSDVLTVSVKSLSMPGVLMQLGTLQEVVYKSDKFDGRKRLYVHKFGKDKPVLAAGGDGRLYIIGGGYKITERGIER